MNYQTLERTIGHSFADIALLDLAMTHPSYALQHKCQDNQRLEFLGDAVLEICVSRVLYHKYPKLREGQLTRKRLFQVRFSRFMQAVGVPDNGKGAAMNDRYEELLSTHADLMPGALTALEELGEVATLAIVSNGSISVQEPRIAASGIDRFMDGIYISEKIGAAKPSAKFFEYALRDLGITNRRRVLVVGDDLLADIKGGINAGLDTCWVNFKNQENNTGIQPKYTVTSFEELYRIVMEPEELENLGVRNRRHSNEAL